MKRVYQLSFILLLVFAAGVISLTEEVWAKVNAARGTRDTQDEYVFMKSNGMMWHYNGKDMVLAATYPCSNGTKVSTSGLVTKSDSTTLQLMNGDKVFADGSILQLQPTITSGR